MLKNETRPESNQDMFNRVYQHFVIEKNPRCGVGGGPIGVNKCYYRYHGNGCAIGCVLPDRLAKISDNLTNQFPDTAIATAIKRPSVKNWLKNVDLSLMIELQKIHDDNFHAFKNQMYELAENFNLTIPNEKTN
jgi:hypothetical protein